MIYILKYIYPFKLSRLFSLILLIVIWEFFLRSNFVKIWQSTLNNHCDIYKISSHGIGEFHDLDIDKNNALTLNEWLPYFYQFHKSALDKPKSNLGGGNEFRGMPSDLNHQIVILKTYFTPLKLQSSLKDYVTENKRNPDLFNGLLNWIEPSIKEKGFLADHFKIFLPKSSNINCGETWWVLPPPVSSQTGEQLSSFAYTPINSSPFLEKLFQMFHPRPFLYSRFEPRGILAGLQALNDDLLKIIFRAHVEFQLEEPPKFPFWFTPSQFSGSLVVNKDGTKVYSFEMEVPADRDLNIDMEWMYGPNEKEHMEVDLGYLPLMKINASLSSTNSKDESIFWTQTCPNITNKIKQIMYPFLKTTYYNLTEALQIAKYEDKLIHSLVLYGVLEDQSC